MTLTQSKFEDKTREIEVISMLECFIQKEQENFGFVEYSDFCKFAKNEYPQYYLEIINKYHVHFYNMCDHYVHIYDMHD